MRRLGVLVFFDANGIVDEYLLVYLKAISEHLDNIRIICNGYIPEEEEKKLMFFSNEIIKRENQGYDGGAYKHFFTEVISGKSDLEEFDEIIIMNDTFFGPINPLEPMFEQMDMRDVDFWGITRHPKYGTDEIRNEHIQSYFIAIRKRMFMSDDFFEFWNNLTLADSFQAAVDSFEIRFTDFFSEKGYSWDCYVDSKYLDNKKCLATNYNQNHYKIYDLLKNKKHPFLKKKDFSINSDGTENMQLALNYVKNETSYDVSLIWKTILRKYNITDIYYCLNLNTVLPTNMSEKSIDEVCKESNIAVFIYISTERYYEYILDYVHRIADRIDVFIYCKNQKISKGFLSGIDERYLIDQKVQVRQGKVFLDKKSAEHMLKVSEKYDYIAYLHDLAWDEENSPNWIVDESMDHLWQNTVGSDDFIANVIQHFMNNRDLGLMCPTFISHSIYMYERRDRWKIDFSLLEDICRLSGYSIDLNQWKYPQYHANVFWCRKKVWHELLENFIMLNKYLMQFAKNVLCDDLIGTLLPFIAQGIGFYSENLLSADRASSEISLSTRRLQVRAETAWEEHLWFEKQLKQSEEKISELTKELEELRACTSNEGMECDREK